VADHVADAAVTLVGDPANVIPLSPARIAVAGWEGDAKAAEGLVQALRGVGREADVVPVDRLGAIGAGTALAIPVGARSGAEAETTRQRLEGAIRTGLPRTPVVVIATGTPYILAQVPDGAARLAAYGTDPASLGAVARVLAGMVRPSGSLPVTLPRDV
jgi:beta-N-acetylhexosaminidase